MNKNVLLKSPWAYDVNPEELETFQEFCVWLEAMLSGPCGVWEEEDGTTVLLNQRALVQRVRGMTIVINPNEHPPPHFHVQYAGNNVSFTIKECKLLAGSIGNREIAIIKHWHKFSKTRLIQKWNSTRPTNCPVGLIQNNG